jgi:hypothetical protein
LTTVIGAGPGERTDTRTNLRNGHRSRILSTTAGDLELCIPKLRTLWRSRPAGTHWVDAKLIFASTASLVPRQ